MPLHQFEQTILFLFAKKRKPLSIDLERPQILLFASRKKMKTSLLAKILKKETMNFSMEYQRLKGKGEDWRGEKLESGTVNLFGKKS